MVLDRGDLNIADWITHPKTPNDICPKLIWQTGPKFLCSPEGTWPIHREWNVFEIPEIIKRVMVTKVKCEKIF